MFWHILIILILIGIVLCLTVKICVIYYAMNDVLLQLKDGLEHDSNRLLTVVSIDHRLKRFVNQLNQILIKYRNERLKFQNGNVEIETAITNISHDLRTPLTAIRGYLELCKKETSRDDIDRYIRIIENRTNTMEQLTEELFRYSLVATSTEELLYEEVSLNAVLDESIAEYYPVFIKHNMVPEICMTEHIVKRMLDKKVLMRIISNIISNAIKYSEGDFKITLSDDGSMSFSNHCRNMNRVDASKLFHRFYTVESARNSTGLGLAIAKNFVEKMDGEIIAEYEKERLSIKIRF